MVWYSDQQHIGSSPTINGTKTTVDTTKNNTLAGRLGHFNIVQLWFTFPSVLWNYYHYYGLLYWTVIFLEIPLILVDNTVILVEIPSVLSVILWFTFPSVLSSIVTIMVTFVILVEISSQLWCYIPLITLSTQRAAGADRLPFARGPRVAHLAAGEVSGLWRLLRTRGTRVQRVAMEKQRDYEGKKLGKIIIVITLIIVI